ncbi:MAG TPA: hypothetical protein V6C81_04040 [Planktothrix sp.]|jgi:hypothetical protein
MIEPKNSRLVRQNTDYTITVTGSASFATNSAPTGTAESGGSAVVQTAKASDTMGGGSLQL